MIKDMGCLSLCLLGNFSCFFVVCWFFSKSIFSKNSFTNTIRVSNSLDPDQARQNVGPDLDPNCLQRLSADDTRRQSLIIILGCLWVNRLFISCPTVPVFRVRINQETRYTHAVTELGWASAKFMSSLHNFIALSLTLICDRQKIGVLLIWLIVVSDVQLRVVTVFFLISQPKHKLKCGCPKEASVCDLKPHIFLGKFD